jgi:hypothetical protein
MSPRELLEIVALRLLADGIRADVRLFSVVDVGAALPSFPRGIRVGALEDGVVHTYRCTLVIDWLSRPMTDSVVLPFARVPGH